jgi:hypothetical protein
MQDCENLRRHSACLAARGVVPSSGRERGAGLCRIGQEHCDEGIRTDDQQGNRDHRAAAT